MYVCMYVGSPIIGTDFQVYFLAGSSVTQSVCEQLFSLLESEFHRQLGSNSGGISLHLANSPHEFRAIISSRMELALWIYGTLCARN